MKKFTTILATGLLMTALVAGTVLADTNKDASDVSVEETVQEEQEYSVGSTVIKRQSIVDGDVFAGNHIYFILDVTSIAKGDSKIYWCLKDSNGKILEQNENVLYYEDYEYNDSYTGVFWFYKNTYAPGNYTVTYWTDLSAPQSFTAKVVQNKSNAIGPYAYWEVKDNVLYLKGKGRVDDRTTYQPYVDGEGGAAYNVSSIVVEEGITYLGDAALYGVSNYDNHLYLPKSLQKMGYILYGCGCSGEAPYDVYYAGTKEEFESKFDYKEITDYQYGYREANDPVKFYFHTHSYTNGVCSCGNVANGLAKVSGVWGYYVKGKLQTTKTGIVQKAASTDKNWYFVKNGVFTKASGITLKADGSSKTWFYVKDGVYTKATGIAQKADKSSTAWYYVANGVYTTSVSGIAQKADRSSTSWFYVKNGVYTKATGIAQKADKSSATWYYVANGTYNKATGISKKADGSSTTWYYVKSGVYTKATCIAPIAGQTAAKYYVKAGVWTKTTGKVTVGTKTYTLKAGVVV